MKLLTMSEMEWCSIKMMARHQEKLPWWLAKEIEAQAAEVERLTRELSSVQRMVDKNARELFPRLGINLHDPGCNCHECRQDAIARSHSCSRVIVHDQRLR